MRKVNLIKDRCIGCGACMTIAPDNFTFDEDGRADLINNEINDAAIDASETCPVSAIIIEDNKCCCHEGCTCGEECNCDENNKCSEDCSCNN